MTTVIMAFTAAAVLSGCAAPSPLPQGPDAVWHLVVIGDSTLWELGEAYARRIEQDMAVTVVYQDFAVSTLSAGQVLQALRGNAGPTQELIGLPEAIQHAEVVVMFANPMDSVDPGNPLDLAGCFMFRAPGSCNRDAFKKWTADLKTIWREIFKLGRGREMILRAVDIYNPLVGFYSAPGVLEACTRCWQDMSEAARLAAEAYDIPFLSRYDAFNGPAHTEDPVEKGYIRDDGEHPSELGAEVTAELLSQLGYSPVPPP